MIVYINVELIVLMPMKKIMMVALFAIVAMTANAQKFALIDMEYILKNVPAYERANEQLNQVSKKWQAEVEALNTEAQTMYKNYQNEVVFLSQEQKKAKQEEIYNTVADIADQHGYQLVLDRASDSGIIFGSPKIDISDEVLQKLGY